MTQHEQALPAVTASPQDAYPPAQIARLVGEVGVRKATMPVIQTTMLGVLAGAFIAFGAMHFTLVMTGTALGFGPARLLGEATDTRLARRHGRRRRRVGSINGLLEG